MDSTLKISLGVSLLREQERQEVMTSPGLLKFELPHHRKPVLTAVDLGDHAFTLKGNLVY
jgi:hypothetical protein